MANDTKLFPTVKNKAYLEKVTQGSHIINRLGSKMAEKYNADKYKRMHMKKIQP